MDKSYSYLILIILWISCLDPFNLCCVQLKILLLLPVRNGTNKKRNCFVYYGSLIFGMKPIQFSWCIIRSIQFLSDQVLIL